MTRERLPATRQNGEKADFEEFPGKATRLNGPGAIFSGRPDR